MLGGREGGDRTDGWERGMEVGRRGGGWERGMEVGRRGGGGEGGGRTDGCWVGERGR